MTLSGLQKAADDDDLPDKVHLEVNQSNESEADQSRETESFLPVTAIELNDKEFTMLLRVKKTWTLPEVQKIDRPQINTISNITSQVNAGFSTCSETPINQLSTGQQDGTCVVPGTLHDDQEPETTENFKDYKLCKRLGVDLPFRRRFIHTLWLFSAFIGLGWCVGQAGPAFPDIRLIVKKDLDTASWLFTISSVGYMMGSLAGGVLYDRFNKLLLIAFSVLIIGVTTGIMPWCADFPLMMAVKFLCGIGFGGLDTGGNADLVSIWDEEGRPYMQALHFFFGFGGILSPLATEPFLASKECIPFNNTSGLDNNTGPVTASSLMTLATVSSNMTTDQPACQEVFSDTRIHYAFLISGVLLLAISIPFFAMYINILRSKTPHLMVADKTNKKRPDKLPLSLKIVLLVLLASMMGMYCAVEDTFASFLMTFCINYLKWGKDMGSFATSTHWAAFSVGRFSGIFLIHFFRPVQLISVYCIMLILSFTGLLIACHTYTIPLIWVFIPLSGFSMSIIFASIFTWTEENILEVTGMISSMFLISASFGLMVNPLFLGYLMDNYTPMWFVYLELAESCLCFTLFITIFIIVKKCVKPIK